MDLPGPIKRRALVADDQDDVRALVAELLGLGGYEVEAVETADEAVARADAGLDVVFLDVDMPGGGLNALVSIKRTLPGLRVVVMSGSESYRVPAHDRGADAFLAKPFGLRDMRAALRDEETDDQATVG